MKYFVRLTFAYLTRFKGVIFASVLAGIVLFAFVYNFKHLYKGKAETVGIVGRYQIDELPLSILEKIGQGLTTISEDGKVMPGIAASWETPDNGKTWIFHIDETKTWQDGEKVASEEIS